jgi:co-chaperonin GroES (HSP10)
MILAEHDEKLIAEAVPAVEATVSRATDAYVPEEELFFDPTKLDLSVIERMPQPSGWRLLVLPYRGKSRTEGGIILTEQTKLEDQLQTVVGYVVKVGPAAYADKDRYPDGPWCKEGQWVIFPRYGGTRFRIEGGECRIINDDEVIATIVNPDDILSL